METKEDIPKASTKLASKSRKLPEIPKDQEPYDAKPPRKPPRQIPRPKLRSSSPDLRRRNVSSHRRCCSLTDSNFSSITPGQDGDPLDKIDKRTEKLGREKSSSLCDLADPNDSGRMNVQRKNPTTNTVPSATSSNQTFSIPIYCHKDAIVSRRCGVCHQRIFMESEECVIAQSRLFHTTCFCCAICNTCLDVTDYCYHGDHEKFYCFQHYRQVSMAGEELGNERKTMIDTGPGIFVVAIFASDNSVNSQRKRKQMMKTLVALQHRRTLLGKLGLQLEETMKTAKREERILLWKHWFDVTFEKTMIMKGVTELSYQVKESELCEQQEQLQRKLRRLIRRQSSHEGTQEKKNEEEEEIHRCVLNVIEKRDLLLLELEIERRRDHDEVQKLKSQREKTDHSERVFRSGGTNRDKSAGIFSVLRARAPVNEGQCVIL